MHRSCILPSDLLLRLAQDAAPEHRAAILNTLAVDHSLRIRRAERAARRTIRAPVKSIQTGGRPERFVFDQHNETTTEPGTLARSEGRPPVADASVNQAYDNFGITYRLFWEVFGRDSIDNTGMPIRGLVHYGTNYDNAFWDGVDSMYFGDGDGQLLTDTTNGLDVIGHELAHGVTQHEANLTYSRQSGALNESVSDVFGSLVRQYHLGQSAAESDWLIGADIVGPTLAPALRSLKAPGTANAYDKQPANMDHYVFTAEDNGGVHINSGIPNHAFYIAATTLGGNAWEAPGAVWYAALRDPELQENATFASFAAITLKQATERYGIASNVVDAVRAGWDQVKVGLAASNV